jgi:hypothetical protein
MTSRVINPEPDEEFYSRSLTPVFEGALIGFIVKAMAAAKLDVVNADNAGQLLSIIFTQAGLFHEMPKCPSYLSTLEECNDYVKTHPDIVTLLANVHAKHAYAWLREQRT